MAKFKFEGIDEYMETLEKLGRDNTEKILKYAVYPGAGIVADAVKDEILTKHTRTGDLASSMILSTMRNDKGYVYTKLEFAGYDGQYTPQALKAAALESGTSRGQPATHFISHTVKRVESKAVEAMSKALDEKIGQIMEG